MNPTSDNGKANHLMHSSDPGPIPSVVDQASSDLPGSADVPLPPFIVLEPYNDRERLYVQYELLRETFNEWFDHALRLGELSADPATANWGAIDIGCGEGLFTGEISTRYPRSYTVGFDTDREAVATANIVFGHISVSSNGEGYSYFYTHDALDPVPSEFKRRGPVGQKVKRRERIGFDVAVVHLVLMHLKKPARVLANIKAALKPGGVVYLRDMPLDVIPFPHSSYKALMEVASEAIQRIATPDCALRHRDYLEAAGFEHVESHTTSYTVGGNTKEGQRMFNNLMSGLNAARPALVDALHLISGEEFDEHMSRLMSDTTPDMAAELKVVNTIARKPTSK